MCRVRRDIHRQRDYGGLLWVLIFRAIAVRQRQMLFKKNSVMLKNFLDFLWNDAKKNPLNLVSYTSEMDARVSELTQGVEID